IFVYDEDEGIYRPEAGLIAEYVEIELGKKATKHVVNEIEGHIERSTLKDRKLLCGVFDGKYIHVANGWLDPDTLELEPHTRDRYSLAKIPTEYNRMAVS